MIETSDAESEEENCNECPRESVDRDSNIIKKVDCSQDGNL